MIESQHTLKEFFELMEAWAGETENEEAKVFLREWRGRSTDEQWGIISPLALKPFMVIDFAEAAAAYLWLLRIGTKRNPFYSQRLHESRSFLMAVYEKAAEFGMQVDIKKIVLSLALPVPLEWLRKEEHYFSARK